MRLKMGLLLFKTCEVYGECLNFKRNPKNYYAIKHYTLPNLTGFLGGEPLQVNLGGLQRVFKF
jgi:hypothetical protein